MARGRRFASVLLVVAAACASPVAQGSSGAVRPSTGADAVASDGGASTTSSLSLLPHQRRWVLETQVTLRWAHDLSEVLKYWWQGADTAAAHHGVTQAEDRVIAFALRHGAPRLAADWSPVTDADHPLARRYDDLMRTALGSRGAAVDHLALVIRAVLDDLGRGDVGHPEIALLISAASEELIAAQPSPNTTNPS